MCKTAKNLHEGQPWKAGSLQKPQGEFAFNSKENLEFLLQIHFPGYKPTQNPDVPGYPNWVEWKAANKLVKKTKFA